MLFLIADKLESALVLLVTPVAGDAKVLPGKDAGDKPVPPVITCSADEDGDEEPKGSGNFYVNGRVEIRASAITNETGEDNPPVDPKAADQALVTAVYGAIRVANLADLLSGAVPDLTVFPGSVIFQATERGRDEYGFWTDVLPFRCLACGSALAP